MSHKDKLNQYIPMNLPMKSRDIYQKNMMGIGQVVVYLD